MLNHNIKIDLHIHSKMSAYKEMAGYVDDGIVENIDILMSKLQENNVNLFSITDHNGFDYMLYKKIKQTINKEPYKNIKNNLPGIEFDVKLEETSKVACHIICIFDDSDDDKVKEIQTKLEEVRKLVNCEDYYTLEEFETILYINIKG